MNNEGKKRRKLHCEERGCQYWQILDNIREVIWVFSPDFQQTLFVSSAYEKIWGCSRESLITAPFSWMDAVHPDDHQAVSAAMDTIQAVPGGDGVIPAFRIVRSNGEVRWIHARLFRIAADTTDGFLQVIVAQDVTRRKFFEAEMLESEERWRSLTENSPDHIMLTDLDGYIFFANRDFLSQGKAELVGKHLLRTIPQPFGKKVQARFRQVVQEEIPDSCFIESASAGKPAAHFEMRLNPLTVSGQIIAVVVNSTDVTSRVEQERILQESEAFHRTLFDESPAGLLIQDFSAIEGPVQRIKDSGVQDLRAHFMAHPDEVDRLAGQVKLVRVNQATVDLYNAPSAEQMIGPLDAVLQNEDRQHFIDQLVAFSSGEDRYEGEARNRDHTGKTLHLIVRKVVFNRRQNGLSKVVTTLTDITAMREAERERRDLLLQLQQAQKMEAIGTLAGGVAHDFNNILGIILGNAELATMDCQPNDPVHGPIQEIRRASLRAKEVVSQLLGFSRKAELVLKSVHLTALVQESVAFMQATLPSNIVIEPDLAAERDVIRADATQIHQVMINLMTNAGHAMEASGGRLSIRTDNVDLNRELAEAILPVLPGHYVRITVADTGAGIPAEIRERIFDPYFTTKKVGKGTGMGLAVVHGILKSCAGGMVLHTRSGEGTRFEIYLPLSGDPAQALGAHAADAPSGNERVLFVDDESMIVDLAEKCLARLGYQVTSCTDPFEALNLVVAGDRPIDLLVSDMTMPGMTGVQLARGIREVNPDVPIILCTGDRERIPNDQLAVLRVAEVLDKPVELNALAAAVRRVFDDRDR